MNFSASWIISVVLLVVGFFGIIISARLFTDPLDDKTFSFMRIFPYEAYRNSGKYNKIYETCCYLFTAMCLSPFFLYQNGSFQTKFLDNNSLFIACSLLLAAVAFLFLNFFGVEHTKAHILLFGGFVLFTFFGSVLLFLRAAVAYSNYLSFGEKQPIFIVAEVLSALSTIFVLFIGFNPKLSNWAKLEKIVGEEAKYVRPKRFVLAYSEWAILFALLFNELVFFVELLI